MVNRIDGSVNMNDTLYNAGLHRAPSLAQFSKKSMNSFVEIMRQYTSDEPGLTLEGIVYEDKSGVAASMAVQRYISDNQNILANFTKLSEVGREMEKSVEKLIG
ncbi:MAG TPA: hypothetical protein DCS13_00885 [Candidatus Margulisbacteria bacterium]|nr:MAG: hypothetical protein A2X43_07825 [Candidatus Margulisbacteria bacterium GWD2_39_127]OGI03868.1 MAG: hypothetical protein A2X42_09905 [Candidatus Margulisbacteria bacterium GWF2_38_17]HAR61999.1 hypothetical protein [Candidatus Margulisiibacteriota bacterium]